MLFFAVGLVFLAVLHNGSAYFSPATRSHVPSNTAAGVRKLPDQCSHPVRYFTRLNAIRPDKQIRRDNEDGLKNPFFAFTEMAEVLNGRLAMTFFAVGIYEEFVTGKSIIEQVGLGDHSEQLSALKIACVFGSLALISFVTKTVSRATEKDA